MITLNDIKNKSYEKKYNKLRKNAVKHGFKLDGDPKYGSMDCLCLECYTVWDASETDNFNISFCETCHSDYIEPLFGLR